MLFEILFLISFIRPLHEHVFPVLRALFGVLIFTLFLKFFDKFIVNSLKTKRHCCKTASKQKKCTSNLRADQLQVILPSTERKLKKNALCLNQSAFSNFSPLSVISCEHWTSSATYRTIVPSTDELYRLNRGKKTRESGEKKSEQGCEPTAISTDFWHRGGNSNPGHLGGRRALSPLIISAQLVQWNIMHMRKYVILTCTNVSIYFLKLARSAATLIRTN